MSNEEVEIPLTTEGDVSVAKKVEIRRVARSDGPSIKPDASNSENTKRVQLKSLMKKRATVRNSLTRLRTFITNLETGTPEANIKARQNRLEGLWSLFDDVQGQIEELLEGTELDAQDHERGEFEENFYHVESLFSQAITTEIANRSNAQVDLVPSTECRLPKIELPHFTGKLDDWIPFWDIYRSMVHLNAKLSDVHKFHYLKSVLNGEAGDLIKNIALTEDNYSRAINMLNERYNNKRNIINLHISKLLNYPKLHKETADGLRRLINNYEKQLASLTALGCSIEDWNEIIVHVVSQQLPAQTRSQWELTITDDTTVPSLDSLSKFILRRTIALENSFDNTLHKEKTKTLKSGLTLLTCPHCSQNHRLYLCDKFKSLSEQERFNVVKAKGLCLNCLSSGHQNAGCKETKCRKCGRGHNTLLHFSSRFTPNSPTVIRNSPSSTSTSDISVDSSTAASTTLQSCSPRFDSVLLQTAEVYVKSGDGRMLVCRAVLDSGSQSSFVTTSLVRRLQLKSQYLPVEIDGVGSTRNHSSRIVELEIQSKYSEVAKYRFKALVLSTITGFLPSQSFSLDQCRQLDHLRFADPKFNVAAPVDLLLASDLVVDVLRPGKISSDSCSVVAINSSLGWLVGGKPSIGNSDSSISLFSSVKPVDYDSVLKLFWEVEEASTSNSRQLTTEEIECENHFIASYRRLAHGQFSVRLPFRSNSAIENTNRSFAERRFKWLEKKFARDIAFANEYKSFMFECLKLGHMVICPNDDLKGYYLSHHAVMKETSTTTKFRVVFDGSSSLGTSSINDNLHIGPRLQNDILSILLRFRKHKIVYTCDLEKMYRQIAIDEQDFKFQKIIFRFHASQPTSTYYLTTVVYGMSSSPYLAIRCLIQLANDGRVKYPIASRILEKDTYIDDIACGANSIDEALEAQNQLIELLDSAGFHARKWSSNCPELLNHLPVSDVYHGEHTEFLSRNETMLLGLCWRPLEDNFYYNIKIAGHEVWTKRFMLSQIAKLFDPFGWIAPITIIGKIMLQKLWLLKSDWDAIVPDAINAEWLAFIGELHLIREISIPRYVGSFRNCELHVFCDASERAYGSCVYVKNGTQIRLLVAKSRVAPLKQVSLPRLELCGLVLAVRLAKNLSSIFDIHISKFTFWTDSTIVLAWVAKPSRVWNTYVANRIAEIQNTISPCQIKHVQSKQNPADLVSRGVFPSMLKSNMFWWQGPEYLLEHTADSFHDDVHDTTVELRKPKTVSYLVSFETFLDKFSCLHKLIRIVAFIFRFYYNCRSVKTYGNMSVDENRDALRRVCRLAQLESFGKEYGLLSQGKTLVGNSRIRNLCPFIDEHGLLRVNSRLSNAQIPYDRKFPIILCNRSRLSKLIVRDVHLARLHSGLTLTTNSVRDRFWILKLKTLVRFVIRHCVKCQQMTFHPNHPQMAPLPITRLELTHPFDHTGLDFCGPFRYAESRCRGRKRELKCYCCLFICFSTKAVHLELLTDFFRFITIESFMSCFYRFTSRRNVPSHLYSDNAKTFLSARKKLDEISRFIQVNNPIMSEKLGKDGVAWNFIPPYTPHMGGLWEAGVKSLKFHLKRVLGTARLTYEEFVTVFCRIEACINARPLTPLSDDVDDLNVLTPSHFLISRYPIVLPSIDQDSGSELFRRRWVFLRKLSDDLCSSWQKTYINNLSLRTKWRKDTDELNIGDLVILKGNNIVPGDWVFGRVLKLHTGPDGKSRVADLKTTSGVKRRSVHNMIRLEIDKT